MTSSDRSTEYDVQRRNAAAGRPAATDNLFLLPLDPKAPEEAVEEAFSIDAQTARSAEVFLRTSYATHMALHGMADNKSRMLIQMNGVVLSLLIAHESRLVPSAELDGSAIITLLCASVLSMALALLAARPPRRQGGVTRTTGDALNVIGRSDFATSGGGFEASVDRFASLVRDVQAIDRGLLTSLHRLGEMLEAKHRLLRLAYLTFGLGMATTAVILGCSAAPIGL